MDENKAKTSVFYCKQFSITQTDSVLKVNTESLLFGAYCAQFAEKHFKTIPNTLFLDIGSGTGLLSIMVAQKVNHATIKGIEIEEKAHQLALLNAKSCLFSHQIQFENHDIIMAKITKSFDFVFCNPPFFQNHLQSSSDARNGFLHNKNLKLSDLPQILNRSAKPDGYIALLLPLTEIDFFTHQMNELGWFQNYTLDILPIPNATVLRQIVVFGKKQQTILENKIIIKDSNKEYTTAFKTLLQGYYQIFD